MKTESEKATPEAQLRSFYDKFDSKHQKLIRSIQTALRRRLPTAHELAYDYSSFFVVAYSPSENGIEAIVSIAARADRVDLYFNNGPKLPDPKKLLRGSGKQARFVQLDSARRLAHPDIKALIDAAIVQSKVPLPTKGKGDLIIKTNKTVAAKKPARRGTTK